MKIVIAAKSVYPFHPVGGVQKYAYYLAKHLIKEGVDVEVVAPLDQGKPRKEIYEGINYTLLWPSIYWYLEYPVGWLGVHIFSRVLARYLRTKDFDLLHSFDMTGYQYLKVSNRKPVIAQIYTDNYLSNPISSRNPFNLLSLFGCKTENIKQRKVTISPFADTQTVLRYPAQYFLKAKPMHFCLEEANAVFLEEDIFQEEVAGLFKIPFSKCATLPVGIDMSLINERMKRPGVSRKDVGLNDDNLVLLTVNRLAADKGVDKIILAFSEIAKALPKARLLIIGEGYQKKELQALILKKGLERKILSFERITEEKLFDFYKLSDIYICAFSYPGSSMSTLEAMACGLPVVTTAQPWLVSGGKNGVILKDNDPALIQEAVLALARDGHLKQKGEISRVIALRYDWLNIAKTAKARYENIIYQKKA